MKETKKESNWYAVNLCSNCEQQLTFNQKMYSSGVCPYCGANSGDTICNTKTVVQKTVIITKYFWGFIPIDIDIQFIRK